MYKRIEDETHDRDVPAISHNRGLAPFVFVLFEARYATSALTIMPLFNLSSFE
jgi:hypothetical protein